MTVLDCMEEEETNNSAGVVGPEEMPGVSTANNVSHAVKPIAKLPES